MKKLLGGFIILLLLNSCSSNDVSSTSESDIDAARNFIRASLDNDFDKARSYMILDSLNNEYLDAAMRHRASRPREENRLYKEASIRIFDTRKESDSVSIISYSNSYRNAKDSLKVVKNENQWLVDLKYSFSKQ
jgi:hypothetical protein